MPSFSTPAILLKRIPYGDYDLIVTFLTLHKGKFTAIAKNAKKSQKRFAGILEPFSQLNLVCSTAKGRLAVLQEASLEDPFFAIRGNILKTAYASYWAESVHISSEEGKAQQRLYDLLKYSLHTLDTEEIVDPGISIVFQTRFLALSGLSPNLSECAACKKEMEKIDVNRLIFELAKGGLVCQGCSSNQGPQQVLSKGTIKQLIWIRDNDLKNLKRLKFTKSALDEGLKLLEAFVPYHLGKEPKSLQFLKSIRPAQTFGAKV